MKVDCHSTKNNKRKNRKINLFELFEEKRIESCTLNGNSTFPYLAYQELLSPSLSSPVEEIMVQLKIWTQGCEKKSPAFHELFHCGPAVSTGGKSFDSLKCTEACAQQTFGSWIPGQGYAQYIRFWLILKGGNANCWSWWDPHQTYSSHSFLFLSSFSDCSSGKKQKSLL